MNSSENPFLNFPEEDPIIKKEKRREEMSTEESYRRMEGLIQELVASSKFGREIAPDGREVIKSPESDEFFIRRVRSAEDPSVKKIHEFLVKEFSEDEADTLETIQGAVGSDILAYHVIEDASGKIVALSNAEYLELEAGGFAKQDGPTDAVIFVAYILTDKAQRKQGIGSELYQDFYRFGLEEAQARDHRLKGIIGEAVSSVESFLNRMGRKRMYFEDEVGNVREVPYMQAPIDWDKRTGRAKTKATPEHLMLRLLDGRQEMQVEELLPMVKAVYKENYVFSEGYFRTKKAYEACKETVMGQLNDLVQSLQRAKRGKFFLMSAQEREVKKRELEAHGKKLYETKSGEESEEIGHVESKERFGAIEPLQRQDVERAIEILKLWPDYFNQNDAEAATSDFERHFNNHENDTHYFVVRNAEGIIVAVGGYGRERLMPDVYYIGYFAVGKALQRKGIGGELLKKIEADMKEKARLLIIRAEEKGAQNPTALFYEKHGYKKTGTVPDYWGDGYHLTFWVKRLKPISETGKE
jgi:GNAT superfamily N-acetyltransferase